MESQRLKAKTIDAIRRPGLHADGAGLFLQIAPAGSRSWIYRYKSGGKQKSMGLGGYPGTSLASARTKAGEAKQLRSNGTDPLAKKKEAAAARRASSSPTFRECVDQYLDLYGPDLKNDKHRAQWRSTLYGHAVPVIGNVKAADVSREQVLDIVSSIWRRTPETASRLRGRIESILGYAIARGHRTAPNCAEWNDLKGGLPKRKKDVKHHSAMPFVDVPTFVSRLRERQGLPELALELLILTAVRTRELLLAEHNEFDLEAKLWTIPTARMKVKSQPHRVPLAPRAVEIVKLAMEHRRGDEQFLFPGRVKKRPFSDMLFLMLLRRMEQGEFTGHGFRASFKTWASETTPYPDQISEMALAHDVGSEVSRSYQRSDLLEKRRSLMIDWAAFVGSE